MTYHEFVDEWVKYGFENREQRLGQSLFNCLDIVRPELANEICATDIDPFYTDSKVFDCFKFIRENW